MDRVSGASSLAKRSATVRTTGAYAGSCTKAAHTTPAELATEADKVFGTISLTGPGSATN